MSGRKRKRSAPQRLDAEKRACVEQAAQPGRPVMLNEAAFAADMELESAPLEATNDSEPLLRTKRKARPQKAACFSVPSRGLRMSVNGKDLAERHPASYLWRFHVLGQGLTPPFTLEVDVPGAPTWPMAVARFDATGQALAVQVNASVKRLALVSELVGLHGAELIVHTTDAPKGNVEVFLRVTPAQADAEYTLTVQKARRLVHVRLCLLHALYPQTLIEAATRTKKSDTLLTETLFASLAEQGLGFPTLPPTATPAALRTALRPYQWRAVSWMLAREHGDGLSQEHMNLWCPLTSLVDDRPFFSVSHDADFMPWGNRRQIRKEKLRGMGKY